MRRPGARVALPCAAVVVLGASIMVLGAAVAAFVYFRKSPDACKIAHVRFDPKRPEAVGRASPDQRAVLAVDGPPQAFTMYLDPQSGSTLEEWSYFTTGRETVFLDGSYQGGVAVPLPELDASVSIPDPAVYPWEILADPRPACVVKLAGPALFRTSALVLPGWNDGYEVARLWTLAGGGSMITVDGRLALVSLDPGEALGEDRLQVSALFVGTLGEGANRVGAILSPGAKIGTYRLSLSPRGQGTTQDGTEVVLDLEGTRLDRAYVLGTDARAGVVDLDGAEKPAQASGTVSMTRRGDAYEVRFDGRVGDRDYSVSGMMGSGLWRSTDRALGQVLGESGPPVLRRTPAAQPTASTAPGDILWSDAFVDPASGLLHDYEDDSRVLRYVDGEYHMVSKKGSVILSRYNRAVGDLDVEVSARRFGGGNGSYGLSVRDVSGSGYYWLDVRPAIGTYALYKWNGAWTVLEPYTVAASINRGDAWNRLRVRCQGPEITVYINGTQVTTVKDSELVSGRIGLSVAGEGMQARFDNLTVRVP